MARVCQVTGKGPMVGNNVSHANNKTKRRFLPNLQYRRFWVESENRWVRLRITNAALRLIDKVGIEQVVADLRAARRNSEGAATMAKGGREKIKLESTRRHRPLLHDRQEQEDDAGEDRDHEVRSEGAQARDLQGNEAQVSDFAEPRRGRRGDPLLSAMRRVARATLLACCDQPSMRARHAGAARTPAARRCRSPRPCGTRPAARRRAARPRRWCASRAGAAPRASPPAWRGTG